MALETRPWDAAEYLDSPETIAAYLDAAFEDGDPALVATALGAVARAKGMGGISGETELSRQALYRALSDKGNPSLATLLKVMKALGFSLSVRPSGSTAHA